MKITRRFFIVFITAVFTIQLFFNALTVNQGFFNSDQNGQIVLQADCAVPLFKTASKVVFQIFFRNRFYQEQSGVRSAISPVAIITYFHENSNKYPLWSKSTFS